jgi:hypothetical protein
MEMERRIGYGQSKEGYVKKKLNRINRKNRANPEEKGIREKR